MKIYDCFTFYNEFDLLELRLAELYDHVDHFVLVEANTTYTSIPKPFLFDENKERYAKWMDKIIHVKVEDMPNSPDAWVNDRFQRDQIYRGIENADPDDLILISDLDEIFRVEAIEQMRQSSEILFAIRMPLFNFKLNYMRVSEGLYDIWGMAGRRHLFNHIKPDAFRFLRFQFMHARGVERGCEIIEHGGWHFGYMGNVDWLKNKAQTFAHTECNTPEFIAHIDPDKHIQQRTSWSPGSRDVYKIVELNSYFPKTVVNNPEKYSGYVSTEVEAKAVDFLPPYSYTS
jgi:hypothetical protein